MSAQRRAKFELRIVGQQGAGDDDGRVGVAPAQTTMRAEAHISSSGGGLRMPQQAVVISGTSAVASISGNSVSATGSAASIGDAEFGEQRGDSRRAPPRPARSRQRRPATCTAKPVSASQRSPSIAGCQLRRPRSASCSARV